jgi:hypothetical protein
MLSESTNTYQSGNFLSDFWRAKVGKTLLPPQGKSQLRCDRGLRRPRGRFNSYASPAQPLLLRGGKKCEAYKAVYTSRELSVASNTAMFPDCFCFGLP